MNSLEALDILYTHLENANQVVVIRECSLVYQTIKQDLEHKKQLEKEIAELKDKIVYFKEEVEGWQNLYYSSQNKNLLLKLKIQELEEVIENEN